MGHGDLSATEPALADLQNLTIDPGVASTFSMICGRKMLERSVDCAAQRGEGQLDHSIPYPVAEPTRIQIPPVSLESAPTSVCPRNERTVSHQQG
jgi:hypothetical protein